MPKDLPILLQKYDSTSKREYWVGAKREINNSVGTAWLSRKGNPVLFQGTGVDDLSVCELKDQQDSDQMAMIHTGLNLD